MNVHYQVMTDLLSQLFERVAQNIGHSGVFEGVVGQLAIVAIFQNIQVAELSQMVGGSGNLESQQGGNIANAQFLSIA